MEFNRVEYFLILLLCVAGLSPLWVRHAGAVDAGAPSSLQEALDRRCVQLYNEICQGGRSDFCAQKLTPVARKGVGTLQQNENMFRCYDITAVSGEQVDKSALGVYCVDNCGNLIRCKGTVKQAIGSFHASRHDEITKWIEAAMATYCSELQTNVDKTCNSRVTGSLGRIRSAGRETSIACVPTENLVFEDEGNCYNQCGFPSDCPGKPATGQTYSELSASDVTQLLHDFHRPCKAYQACTQLPGEPVKCTDESEYQADMSDTLQRWLDYKCKLTVERMCKSMHSSEEMCQEGAVIVMRKGIGHRTQTDNTHRCYHTNKIQRPHLIYLGTYGVSCIDNCGKDVHCGGEVNIQSLAHTTPPTMGEWIAEGKRIFCSPYQNALQSVCDSVSPGSIARYGVSVYDGSPVDSWRCLKSPLVVYEGKSKCLNNCDRLIDCSGGRLEDVSSDWSLQQLLSPEQVQAALRDVKSPCQPTEVCSATSRNPPQCNPVTHQGGASGGNSVQLEDGDTLETTFNSSKVLVRIGDCFQAKIDMGPQEVVVGSGDHPTVISTAQATPPSKLSLHRSGGGVNLTLQYSLDSESSPSLFIAQPSATCVSSEPVVFEGLEQDAQVSRSGTRSITS